MLTALITGGARSGKSRRAMQLAQEVGGERVFIATAEPSDTEMADRIARHQGERGEAFRTVEAPLYLVQALETEVRPAASRRVAAHSGPSNSTLTPSTRPRTP